MARKKKKPQQTTQNDDVPEATAVDSDDDQTVDPPSKPDAASSATHEASNQAELSVSTSVETAEAPPREDAVQALQKPSEAVNQDLLSAASSPQTIKIPPDGTEVQEIDNGSSQTTVPNSNSVPSIFTINEAASKSIATPNSTDTSSNQLFSASTTSAIESTTSQPAVSSETLNESEVTSLINKEFLESLERNAKVCAQNLVDMMDLMRSNLKSITGISLQHMEIYKQSSENMNEAVNTSISDMNRFITKCQDLSEDLKPLESLANDIKEVRKSLDQFEAQLNRMK